MSGRVVHFEIPFDDGNRARAFYSEAFGWDVSEMPEMDYTMVSTGPTEDAGPTEPGFVNGGMAQRGDSFTAPTVVIDVEDIDATLREVEARGGQTLSAKSPVAQMGWSAYFRDSEGNVVGLWQTNPDG